MLDEKTADMSQRFALTIGLRTGVVGARSAAWLR